MMGKTVALHTLGCKLNFSETSTIGNQFLNKGYDVVAFKEKADVYVLNTCTVTEHADRECRQLVRRALRQNPSAYVIVTGCYAQLRPEEISNIQGVDAILGSNEKLKLFSLLEDFEKKDLACIYVSPVNNSNEFGASYSTDADTRTRAYFKIQDGCDYNCSFCTIPLARGNSRSMEPVEVLSEFKHLVSKGYKEIILTGVNVGDYGKSFDFRLYDLLSRMVDVEGNFRIRISSIEPNLLSDDILQLTHQSEKMCKHFHIPLQSGSPKILKLMQRRYKAEYYAGIIYKVSELINHVGIGVDVIVGFPGETEEDFLTTYNFIKDLPVSYLHVFSYSERPDTKAITMSGKVVGFERKRRNNMLRILSDKKKNLFYESMAGKELEVLFESENDNGNIKGFSSNYVRVSNKYAPSLINELSVVKIEGVRDNLCYGNILGNKKSIDLIAC
jgi:threonylcarbamoyladenosine tRNA methylthiotransferase MtaB